MHLFAVEGNIGSGKTTFLRQIDEMKNSDIQVIYEPVDTWLSEKDKKTANLSYEK